MKLQISNINFLIKLLQVKRIKLLCVPFCIYFSDPLFLQWQMQLSLILENFIKTTFCKVKLIPQYFSVEEQFVIIYFTCFWWRIQHMLKKKSTDPEVELSLLLWNILSENDLVNMDVPRSDILLELGQLGWIGLSFSSIFELGLLVLWFLFGWSHFLATFAVVCPSEFWLLKCCFFLSSAPYFCDFLVVFLSLSPQSSLICIRTWFCFLIVF